MTRDQIVDVMKQCTLLADFSTPSLLELFEYLDALEGARGDRLFSEGDPAGGLYIVLRGTCVTKVRDVRGEERTIAQIGPAGSFGELSLLLRSERLVTVEALDDVRLVELSLASFRRLKSTNPELCLMLIMAIVRRFGRVLDESKETLKRVVLRGLEGVEP
jgi:CRP-like cAMP-binding protein